MKRRHGNSSSPALKVTAVRPPGMKRAIAISSPPRSFSWRSAHSIRRRDFSPPKKRSTTRVPKRRPIQYAVLSPRNAPAAAAGTTIARLRSPALATTPAVMTAVSLGTIGTTASSNASRNTIAYAHPEASETSWVKWPNTLHILAAFDSAVTRAGGARAPAPPCSFSKRLVLWRLAGAEREREVAPARAHVLDTGDLRDHASIRGEDVEELGVAELVLSVHVVEIAAEPGRAGEPVDGARRPVAQRHADRGDRYGHVLAAVGGEAVVEDGADRPAEHGVVRARAGEDRSGRVERRHLRRARVARGVRRQSDDEHCRRGGERRENRDHLRLHLASPSELAVPAPVREAQPTAAR